MLASIARSLLVLATLGGGWAVSPMALASEGSEAGGPGAGAPAPDGPAPTRAPTHPDCDHRMPLYEHVVQPGEHLGVIAGRYGVRRRDLVALNSGLKDPDLIRPGQKIRVCPEIYPRVRREVVYEVQPGDTLSEIADAHGLTVGELVEVSDGGWKNPDHVRVGQNLRFWVDGGLVEDFAPPPKPKKRSRVGTRRRAPVSAKLPATRHIHVKRPRLAYGTTKTVALIERAIASYKRRFARGPKVHVGDLSKRGGGKLAPHVSHRAGRDVDIGYVLTGEDASRTRFSGVNRENLDVARTWALVKAFLDTHEVVYVFMDYGHQKVLYEYARRQGASEGELDELFQYPRGRGRSHGIIRHWRSHKHHFHVRFRP